MFQDQSRLHLIPSIATNHQNTESVSISDSTLSISLSPPTKCVGVAVLLCSLRMKIILRSGLRAHYSCQGYECDVLPIHLNWSALSPGWAAAAHPDTRTVLRNK